MKERLISFMQDNDLSSIRLAEILGVQPSGISHLLAGRNKPGFDFIAKIITAFPKLSPDWIILGVGEMYRDSSKETIATDPHHKYIEPINLVTDVIKTTDRPLPDIENKDSGNTVVNNDAIPLSVQKSHSIEVFTQKVIILLSDGTFKDYNRSE